MKKIVFLPVVVIFCSFFFCACKKTSQATALVGNWSLTDTFPPNAAIVNLNLDIIDNSNYTFSATTAGNVIAPADTGTYKISNDLITFTSTNTTSPCLGQPGEYTFGVSGGYLSIILVSDNCNFGLSPRADYFVSTNWKN